MWRDIGVIEARGRGDGGWWGRDVSDGGGVGGETGEVGMLELGTG